MITPEALRRAIERLEGRNLTEWTIPAFYGLSDTYAVKWQPSNSEVWKASGTGIIPSHTYLDIIIGGNFPYDGYDGFLLDIVADLPNPKFLITAIRDTTISTSFRFDTFPYHVATGMTRFDTTINITDLEQSKAILITSLEPDYD